MPARFPSAALAVVIASALTACGNSGPTPGGELTSAQRAAREQLIEQNKSLNDVQLAHLCPALYPKDVLTKLKKYGFDSQKATAVRFTAAQLNQARAGRCGNPIPFAATKQPAAAEKSKP